jgi:hypothetical protein
VASRKDLASWLLTNADHLNLRATQLQWPERWNCKGLVDLEVQIEIDGRQFTGRGTAQGENQAFTQAGAEALERCICASNDIHSTGVAVHLDQEHATTAATWELSERETFFNYFYSQTPFKASDSKWFLEIRKRYPTFFEEAQAFGMHISFHQDHRSKYPLFICLAQGAHSKPPFGGLIGLSRKKSESLSVESSFFECARKIADTILNESPEPTLSLEDFIQIKKPSSSDRQKLARNTDYWRQVQFLFPATPHIDESPPYFPELTVHVESLKKIPRPIHDAPIVTYRATLDEKYGPLLFGQSTPVTLSRLSEFKNQQMRQDQLNRLPHFLG